MVSAVIFWFIVDYCFHIMSFDGLVYNLIFKAIGSVFVIELILYTYHLLCHYD